MGLLTEVARDAVRAHQRSEAMARVAAAPNGNGAQPEPGALDPAIYGPGQVPEVDGGREGRHEPGDLKHILDDAAEFTAKHLYATRAQVDAIVLYAAATHALCAFPACGRLLFTSEAEESGKTLAMMLAAALSANPLDVGGTNPALTSTLAAAANTPEQPQPTLYYDEISTLFGRSGLNASRSQIADVLRRGYKAKATSQWSVNRMPEKFSIYTAFLMTGLMVAVPRDIRTRCITIRLEPGTPRAYYDVREGEPEAEALAASVEQAVRSRLAELALFRAGRRIHPQLKNRKLEVWEPLFAVAWVLGGQEWLNRCRDAFRELAVSESEQVRLTPRQQVLRDAVALMGGPLAGQAESGFIGGEDLAREMLRLDNPLYADFTLLGLCGFIAEKMPFPPRQKRVPWNDGKPVRGYFARAILEAWDAARPAESRDVELEEEENPFEVTDDTEDAEDVTDYEDGLSSDVADVTDVGVDLGGEQ